jgi:hypothetical protein
MKARAALTSLVAVASLASAGCYRTRFDLSPPMPETPSTQYDNHFHVNVINLIEVSRPVDLQRACMGAPPTAIEEEVGVLGAIVNGLLSYVVPILSVHNATVMCPAGAPMGQPYGYPQPAPHGQPYPPQGQPYPPPQ